MKKYLVFLYVFLFFYGCETPLSDEITWILESEAAPWQPRDSQGEFVHDGCLWILGGWETSVSPNLLDVWRSCDGVKWERVIEEAPWVQSDLPVSVSFGGKMWMMGGRKLPGTEVSNKVWSSEDGADWDLEAEAGWSPRLGAGYTVFNDKIWVMGGTSDFYDNNDSTLMNDVWSSVDGIHWELESAEAEWSKRAYMEVLVFDDKMWLLGGGMRAPEAAAHNDVWYSEDGVNWVQVNESVEWDPRIWFSSVVYRNKMWVLGGWSPDNHNFGDVWYSEDGESWTELEADSTWTPRHEHSAFVFDDRIWIAGGAAEPDYLLNSEVWSLSIPENWFKK